MDTENENTGILGGDTVDDAALAAQNIEFGDEDHDEGALDGKQAEVKADEKPADEKPEGDDKDSADDEKSAKKDDDAEGDKSPNDDDEEFVEVTREEGGEPERVALSEVFDGYNRSKELETQLKEATDRQQAMPAEIEHALHETMTTRQQLVEQLGQWSQMAAPAQPGTTLLDPNHPDFDPDGYRDQITRFQQFTEQQEAANKELAVQRDALQKEQAIRTRAVTDRETEETRKFWPELLADKGVMTSFRKEMQTHYNATDDDINSIADHRFFKMAKDALAYRASQEATKKAVKVVRAKPKIVRGKARDTNAKRTAFDGALTDLSKTGSDEAAIAALDAL